jgi:hypothetical protein
MLKALTVALVIFVLCTFGSAHAAPPAFGILGGRDTWLINQQETKGSPAAMWGRRSKLATYYRGLNYY